jgi:hypothetical protein
MSEPADLELSLQRHSPGAYRVEFRYNQPDSDTDVRLAGDKPARTRIPFDELERLKFDPQQYGQALSQALFADPEVRLAYERASASAESAGLPLRLRLQIEASEPELQNLAWETLYDPHIGLPMAMNEKVLFSRYLSSQDLRPVRLRAKGELRAVLAAASPINLEDYSLAPFDVQTALSPIRDGLGALVKTSLPDGSSSSHITLEAILASLRAGCDILYLVCHGTFDGEETYLWLEDEQGRAAQVAGSAFAANLAGLEQPPRLVVLATCESAGDGAGQAMSALGPRLVEAGIPAVVAMQGKISMQTSAQFMGTFFKELLSDGRIDRAMAVARGSVRQQPDCWMPVLFMRLKSGKLWYIPGFSGERGAFEQWDDLLRYIKRKKCTPILGPALYDALLGSQREIAMQWAQAFHYPMRPHERDSLPQVAQYLAAYKYTNKPFDELVEYLKKYIQQRFLADLPDSLDPDNIELDELLNIIGDASRTRNTNDPYKLLAELPLPIYITTNGNNLLGAALAAAGRQPQVVLCPWNDHIVRNELHLLSEDYIPDPDHPLVYHMFGRLSDPRSYVLTEDHYFDFLIGAARNKELIPPVVRRVWSNTSLLFLGFQMDDWQFRVLFRSIMSQAGGSLLEELPHIAVQIEPEEGKIIEPQRARRFLEKYFSKTASINLFWGSVEDFISEMLPHLAR